MFDTFVLNRIGLNFTNDCHFLDEIPPDDLRDLHSVVRGGLDVNEGDFADPLPAFLSLCPRIWIGVLEDR